MNEGEFKFRGHYAPKRRAATEDELEIMLAMSKTRFPKLSVCLLLAGDCGLRHAEIADCKVSHVQAGKVYVPEGKGGIARYTVCTARTQAALHESMREKRRPGRDGHASAYTYKTLSEMMVILRSACDLPSDLCWHSLRHTFAFRLARAGMAVADIAVLMGHSYLTSTLCYMHTREDHMEVARAALEARPVSARFRILKGGQE